MRPMCLRRLADTSWNDVCVPGDAVAEDGPLRLPCCWGDWAGGAPLLPSGLAGPARPDAAAASLDLAEGDLFVRRLLGGSDPSPAALRRQREPKLNLNLHWAIQWQ